MESNSQINNKRLTGGKEEVKSDNSNFFEGESNQLNAFASFLRFLKKELEESQLDQRLSQVVSEALELQREAHLQDKRLKNAFESLLSLEGEILQNREIQRKCSSNLVKLRNCLLTNVCVFNKREVKEINKANGESKQIQWIKGNYEKKREVNVDEYLDRLIDLNRAFGGKIKKNEETFSDLSGKVKKRVQDILTAFESLVARQNDFLAIRREQEKIFEEIRLSKEFRKRSQTPSKRAKDLFLSNSHFSQGEISLTLMAVLGLNLSQDSSTKEVNILGPDKKDNKNIEQEINIESRGQSGSLTQRAT